MSTGLFVFWAVMATAYVLIGGLILTLWLAERRSPKFPDAACVPQGACEAGRQCAMHDTVFAHVRKRR